MARYEPVIGLEVHAELATRTKMFCGSLNDPDEKQPNKNVCPVCLGHPGTLPAINRAAVESVVKVGLALNCEIAESSHFDRKNYFYPDLPKGYQISQYADPLCRNGHLEVALGGAERSKVLVRRIHLEEDTGRLIHPEGKHSTLVDYNRAGLPLMELVTEPCIHSAAVARRFCEEFQLILRYLGVSGANMEKGQMRCEVNLSLRPAERGSDDLLGTKVEVKNLNSFRAVERAIACEIARQSEVLDRGERVAQETRGWDDVRGQTFSQRFKEEAHDYRYFPEPDLPPLSLLPEGFGAKTETVPASGSAVAVGDLRRALPELPEKRRERFRREYGLADDQIEVFAADKQIGDYFEAVVSELRSEHAGGEYRSLEGANLPSDETVHFFGLARVGANYLINEFPKALEGAGVAFAQHRVEPQDFAELILRIEKNVISSYGAKTVLARMVRTGADPDEIIREQNLAQVSDAPELETAVRLAVERHPQVVKDFQKGKQNALQFLVGQVMKETKGRANPQVVQDILRRVFGGSSDS